MSYGKALARYAALAILASCTAPQLALAQMEPETIDSSFSITPKPNFVSQQAGYVQTELLGRGMGGDFMDRYGVRLNGYAQAGFSFNFDRPDGNVNGPNSLSQRFNDQSDDPRLHQISLALTRDAIVSPDRLDAGFGTQIIFGSDARFTQANGTNFYGSGYAGQRGFFFLDTNDGTPTDYFSNVAFPGQGAPDEQFDLLQAYVTLNVPVGNGLLLTAGKFVTPWGIERINPTENGLYSHSYIFSFSQPMTLTGVTAAYAIDDRWTVMGGVVVGWDQSLEDNNDAPSFVGQVSYRPQDDLVFVLSGIVGPEQEDNGGDLRAMLDLTVVYKIDQNIKVGAEGVIGYESDAGTSFIRPGGGPKFQNFTGKNAEWHGVAGYVDYRLDESGMYVGHLRAEFFNDGEGSRGVATELYAITAGISIHPFVDDPIGKHFTVRPELRYEYADQKVFDRVDDIAERNNQFTAGIDVIFSF